MSKKDNRFTNITTLYKGEVTFKYLVNDKVIEKKSHNEGLSPLFKVIAKCLAGYNTTSDVPIKLDLRYAESGSSEYNTCLNNKIVLSARRFDYASANWSAYYTAVITNSDLLSNAIQSSRTYKLFLLSSTEDMASVDVAYDDLSSIQSGAQALIEWKLTTTN